YLSSIFKQQIGTPLKKYLVDFRISQSEEFLFTTNWSVDYISNLCGFNNPSYFSKTFKNYHGTSPTHYRLLRHHRKNKTVLVDENIKRIQI
ncbi:MAG: helix-turn-helix transcriptional regulator, partial [Lentilactobacillus diolivorans]